MKIQNNLVPFAKNKGRKFYEIKNEHGDEADIFIFDEISFFGITAKEFVDELNQISASTINVRINSPGGDVFDGIAIHTALKNLRTRGKTVNTFVDGISASIAAVITMAGETITMAQGSLLMIHNAVGFVVGDAEELERVAAIMQKINDQIAGIFADRSGKKVSEIKALMDAETWFDSAEAIAIGLADKEVGKVKAVAKLDTEKFKFENLDKYTKLIANLDKTPNKPKVENQNGGDPMNPEQLKAKFPDLYDAVYGLGEVAGKATGDAAGFERGKAEGVIEGKSSKSGALKKEDVENAKTESAKVERERIQAIENIKVEGPGEKVAKEIINENKYKPEMTADKISGLILVAMKAASTGDQTEFTKTGEKIDPSGGSDSPDAAEENAVIEKMVKYGNKHLDRTGKTPSMAESVAK